MRLSDWEDTPVLERDGGMMYICILWVLKEKENYFCMYDFILITQLVPAMKSFSGCRDEKESLLCSYNTFLHFVPC